VFGGAPGYVQYISPLGTVTVPAGRQLAADHATGPGDLRIARRTGQLIDGSDSAGVELRVLTVGAGDAGRCWWRWR
jgi:hypothetical protein